MAPRMIMVQRALACCVLALVWCLPAAGAPAGNYDESLRQLAEGVIAEAVKLKTRRMAVLDFTDANGAATDAGRFLAEEIGTQVLIAGEIHVVERTLVDSALKRFHVTEIDPEHAHAVRRAANALRAEVMVRGSYLESADGLAVTVKLINPLSAEVVGAVRGRLPAIGPLAGMLLKAESPLVSKPEGPREPSVPDGLGFHRNEYYELVVESIQTQGSQAKVGVTLENRSGRDLKVLCLLQDTLLKDDHGAAWAQGIEDNRDGLCIRGLELSPRQKARAVLTFTAPSDAMASHFTLHYHEKTPRRDALFTIDGLRAQPAVSPSLH